MLPLSSSRIRVCYFSFFQTQKFPIDCVVQISLFIINTTTKIILLSKGVKCCKQTQVLSCLHWNNKSSALWYEKENMAKFVSLLKLKNYKTNKLRPTIVLFCLFVDEFIVELYWNLMPIFLIFAQVPTDCLLLLRKLIVLQLDGYLKQFNLLCSHV